MNNNKSLLVEFIIKIKLDIVQNNVVYFVKKSQILVSNFFDTSFYNKKIYFLFIIMLFLTLH